MPEKITVIYVTKTESYHTWIKLQGLAISVGKKTIYLSSQLQEWANISKLAKMADLCNCQQIFLNVSFISCSIPTTLLHYVVNITIWLCCLFQEKFRSICSPVLSLSARVTSLLSLTLSFSFSFWFCSTTLLVLFNNRRKTIWWHSPIAVSRPTHFFPSFLPNE